GRRRAPSRRALAGDRGGCGSARHRGRAGRRGRPGEGCLRRFRGEHQPDEARRDPRRARRLRAQRGRFKMTDGGREEYQTPVLEGSGATDYERYLRTDELLSLQKTAEERVHHDELLFQTVHQASELWLKLATTEVEE